MTELDLLLKNFILDSENSENNFLLALYYDNIGQKAAAISYYLRTAERSVSDNQKYECLLKAAECFAAQGTRAFSVKGLLQHAVALLPKRPEAYYFLSKFFENEKGDGNWFNCYMISSVGVNVCNTDNEPLRTDVGFPGPYALLFQKAVSSWWCGLCEESRNIFKDLLKKYDLRDDFRKIVISNLKSFNEFTTKKLNLFDKSKHNRLKLKFNNSDKIDRNFSEAYQDLFVLGMLKGKQNGRYLEIGAGNPYYGNNTALLEQQFNWRGVSVDINRELVEAFSRERKNICILDNALSIDYAKVLENLEFPTDIDYLQLDCDPPEVTFQLLLTMPFNKYRFAVITYEHDYYCDETKSYRQLSRQYLESLGYVMVAGDIAPDDWRNYEDWWVHPSLVDAELINKIKKMSSDTISAENFMLENKTPL